MRTALFARPYQKTQAMRLVDVFALGPFMIWFGVVAKQTPTWARWTLGLSGAGTVIYNGVNYVRNTR